MNTSTIMYLHANDQVITANSGEVKMKMVNGKLENI